MNELKALRELCHQVSRLRLTSPVHDDFPEIMADMSRAHCKAMSVFGTDFSLSDHLHRQREWSEKTFGPGPRAEGVVDHITKELQEILDAPGDLSEWIDVVILALDGAWRAGHSPETIIRALVAKQEKNEARDWPDWRDADPDKAIEHVKQEDDHDDSLGGTMEQDNDK
jgi:hypothetical protein